MARKRGVEANVSKAHGKNRAWKSHMRKEHFVKDMGRRPVGNSQLTPRRRRKLEIGKPLFVKWSNKSCHMASRCAGQVTDKSH